MEIKKVNVKNVVVANEIITNQFPFGWDCMALATSLEVVFLEDGQFKREVYMIDPRFGRDLPHTEVELEYVDNVEEMQLEYKKFLLQQRIQQSLKNRHSINAQVGDTIEVYKGRKFPKGQRFVVKREYVWRDAYGREQAWYWITEDGKKVDQFNCIIVDGKIE